MKILRLSSYCDPEKVSSSHLTMDLNEAFIRNGFTIENYVPTPSRGINNAVRKKYKKIRFESKFDGKLLIYRFPMFKEGKNSLLRAFRYLLVNCIQYIKGTKVCDIDIIFAGSTPPTQGLLCGLVKKKLNVPFVYNLQDIFPDSLENTGLTKKGTIIWKIGRKIEDYIYKSADKIIVISDDFKKNIISKGVPEEKIVVVPNWVDTEKVYPVPREDNILYDRYGLDRNYFYICYSGNIGHTQNMELLLEAAKSINNPNIQFVLIGEGVAKDELQSKIVQFGIKNIKLLPFQPYEDIAHVFSLGDAGLIISKPGVGTNSVPSKTWSIMAAERPVIASFDERSQLADTIKKANCGLVVKPNEKDLLINAIQYLYNNKKKQQEFGKSGRAYLLNELNKEKCINMYISVIKEFYRT